MGQIMAVVATEANRQTVAGGAPIFIADDANHQQQVAFKLEKILDSAAHDLENGIVILVKH
ncbi:hypothetical protein SAMN04487970_1001153 [Paenibacillus tianmuensis]|uniref:Uncharacterized protein n=1 Tax=Paenibacillus tianmuensis TaxID=624147 RepID=A0A1G4P6K4_9BACL|nr:hypothetical protein [Paenibacillus tianmuensis]SCW27819.1 hypothetical protein SAMN04487970_1001153 [Paenibacillus tianmuensis]